MNNTKALHLYSKNNSLFYLFDQPFDLKNKQIALAEVVSYYPWLTFSEDPQIFVIVKNDKEKRGSSIKLKNNSFHGVSQLIEEINELAKSKEILTKIGFGYSPPMLKEDSQNGIEHVNGINTINSEEYIFLFNDDIMDILKHDEEYSYRKYSLGKEFKSNHFDAKVPNPDFTKQFFSVTCSAIKNYDVLYEKIIRTMHKDRDQSFNGSQLHWYDCVDSEVASMTLQLLDMKNQAIKLRDGRLHVTLLIRDKSYFTDVMAKSE